MFEDGFEIKENSESLVNLSISLAKSVYRFQHSSKNKSKE